MTQEDAFEILKTGRNVFLTGAAGSGKTYLLGRYIAYLREKGIPVAITASTGIAATHLEGTTIHSWCGMGIADTLPDNKLRSLAHSRRLVSRVSNTPVLIIDEISMLDAKRLSLVDRIMRFLRGNMQPFGGIQVVLCGDFFQLPPVESVSKFAFQGTTWESSDLTVCYLREQYRQEDLDYLRILNAIRSRNVSAEIITILRKRMLAEIADISPVRLFSHNENVNMWNAKELAQIEDTPHVYRMESRGAGKLVQELKKSCLAPEELLLKRGAPVMFVKNNFERGFVNGTLGVVDGFEESGHPIVRLKDGRKIQVLPESWCVEDETGNKILAEITQIPLRLAWAITIHKSQGMSMEAAAIDLGAAFVPGMGYVALSRVRSLGGLRLLGLNDMALRVDETVASFDSVLRDSSQKKLKEFSAYSLSDIKAQQEMFLILNGGKVPVGRNEAKTQSSPTYTVAAVRKKYPNAYKAWSEDEDRRLTEVYLQNKTASYLAKVFGRKAGAIRSRLKKLGYLQ